MQALVISRDIAGHYHVIAGRLGDDDHFDDDQVTEEALCWMMQVKKASPDMIATVMREASQPASTVALVIDDTDPNAEGRIIVISDESAPPHPARYVWDRLAAGAIA